MARHTKPDALVMFQLVTQAQYYITDKPQYMISARHPTIASALYQLISPSPGLYSVHQSPAKTGRLL